MRGKLKVFPTKARDEFSGKCNIGYGIVNLDSSKGPGTHFTLWMNLPNEPKVYYFDSYGVVPPENVANWLKTSGKPITYSSSQVQPIASKLCGYYCVYVANQTIHKSFYEAVESFSNSPEQNDKMITKVFDHVQYGKGTSDSTQDNGGDALGDISSIIDIAEEVLPEVLPLLL